MTLLEMTFLVQTLPAWSSNLGKRVVKAPKLFMIDTGLACHLAGIDEEGLRQGGEIAGRIFENFVVLDMFKHASWSDGPVALYHFRSHAGQDRSLELQSIFHECLPGRRKLAVKVVDIFGNGTMKIVEVMI